MIKRMVLVLMFWMGCAGAYGQSVVQEEELKAAFIFHFISFTQWNDDEDSDYFVCIPEDEKLRSTAEVSFSGKVLNGRKVTVVNRENNCHILVSDRAIDTDTILTIGRLEKGALLEFRVIDKKLKFAVNLVRLKKSKLKISSQLLKLAIPEEVVVSKL